MIKKNKKGNDVKIKKKDLADRFSEIWGNHFGNQVNTSWDIPERIIIDNLRNNNR